MVPVGIITHLLPKCNLLAVEDIKGRPGVHSLAASELWHLSNSKRLRDSEASSTIREYLPVESRYLKYLNVEPESPTGR
jgi:hypothetical protein